MASYPPPPPPPPPEGSSFWRSPAGVLLAGALAVAAIAVPVLLAVLDEDDAGLAAETSATTRPPATTTPSTTPSSTSSATTTGPATSSTGDTSAPPVALDPSLDPTYGDASYSPGFAPDPSSRYVLAGGTVDVAYLNQPGCIGYTTARADFSLTWSGTGALLRMYFVADSPDADTVLVVSAPDGTWRCNDDYDYPNTMNPAVDFDAPPSGVYRVWAASYSADTQVDGTLYVTQSAGNHP